MNLGDPWPLILAVVVGTLAVARVVRLVVADEYPPLETVKEWWERWAPSKGLAEWVPVIECPWCFAPYVALPAVLWFASLVAWPGATWNLWLWWIVNGWAALSWAAAYVQTREERAP